MLSFCGLDLLCSECNSCVLHRARSKSKISGLIYNASGLEG